ncbi:unnamed protein product [Darwinula stevensoni]|uniref:Ig-like domain-containing protein n=1 Tax=Darwinula stevensoni TaxID=69355 RepID=A0A7R8X7R8_9CRUS|nr:unnamed protein product [Darwinula stevensoni]CAG0882616.1 unnamed protein product [Darwinula stevensoni]
MRDWGERGKRGESVTESATTVPAPTVSFWVSRVPRRTCSRSSSIIPPLSSAFGSTLEIRVPSLFSMERRIVVEEFRRRDRPQLLLFLLLYVPAAVFASRDGTTEGVAALPFIDNSTETTVLMAVGRTAVLNCRVRNLGQNTLSWVRKKDYAILTSGRYVYSNDKRINMLHQDGSDEWPLQIKFVNVTDNGTYVCQVEPGLEKLSRTVNLQVLEPEAFILGSKEYHVDTGSKISLVCIIEKSPQPPEYVFWYHNGRMLNYDAVRGGIMVTVERGKKTHSRLTVDNAQVGDSGVYTCSAESTKPASISVFITEGIFRTPFSSS